MDIKEQLDKAITMQELANHFSKTLLAKAKEEEEVASCYDKYINELDEQ